MYILRENIEIYQIGEETILYLLAGTKTKKFYLNCTGKFVLDGISKNKSVDDICKELQQKFIVSDELCQSDVKEILNAFEQNGIVVKC